MSTLSIAVVIAAVGIDTGWQPLDDGRFEYILQLEPQVVESLRAGREVASDIPAGLRGARCYRLAVGGATLPRNGTPPAVTSAEAFDVAALKAPAEQFGWQALEGGGFECILQLDSKRLDALAAGDELRGELPAFLHDVRTYRIMLGTQSLPRAAIGVEAGPPSPSQEGPPAAAPTPARANDRPSATPRRVNDSLIREASADVTPSLPSATSEDNKSNLPTSTQDGVSQTAGYVQSAMVNSSDPPDEAGSPTSASPPPADVIPQRLSWREPYTFALIGLFTSFGMNLYLGWVTWNVNHRYRTLRRQIVGDQVLAE